MLCGIKVSKSFPEGMYQQKVIETIQPSEWWGIISKRNAKVTERKLLETFSEFISSFTPVWLLQYRTRGIFFCVLNSFESKSEKDLADTNKKKHVKIYIGNKEEVVWERTEEK